MDIELVRRHAEAHGRAVVDGDSAALLADFSEELLPRLGGLAAALPQPTTGYEVVSVEDAGDTAVVHLRYSGESGDPATVRSVWAGADRPQVVDAAVAEG